MIDPYNTLGVSKSASQDEIRKAYRKLARQYHPDMNQGKADAEAKFKEISEAYELIGSEEKRKKLEAGEMEQAQNEAAWREYWANQNAQRGPFYSQARGRGGGGGRYSFGGGFDEDILKSIFENQFQGGSVGPDVGMGVDEHYQTEVSFEDAALGSERELTLPNGRHVKVKIPAGVKDGQTLKLRGQSSAQSAQGIPPGDVYITLKVRPSPNYRLDGNDTESDLPISLAEAVLGGEVKARVIDGNILVRIPEGANTGQKLKIKGRGAVNPKTSTRGDHYFSLKVMLPDTIDADLREAIRQWSARREYNPREEAEAT